SPRGRNRWKPSATRHSRFRTLLSHLLLNGHLPLRLRPLPFLIPPIMKRLVRRLFLHPSSLHPALFRAVRCPCYADHPLAIMPHPTLTPSRHAISSLCPNRSVQDPPALLL